MKTSFWYGLCTGLIVSICCLILYIFFRIDSKSDVDSDSSEVIANSSISHITNEDAISSYIETTPTGHLDFLITREDARRILHSPNQYSLDEVAVAASVLLQEDYHNFSIVIEQLENVDQAAYRLALRHLLIDQFLATHTVEVVFQTALSTLSEKLQDQVLQDILIKIGDATPKLAIDLVGLLEDSQIQDRLYETVVRTWAKSNPADLYEYYSMLPNEWIQRYGLLQASLVLAQNSPYTEAMQLLKDFENTILEELLMEQIAKKIVEREDFAAAVSWAVSNEFAKPDLRIVALSTVLRHIAQTNPKYSYSQALKIDQDQRLEGYLESLVLKEFATRDPGGAVDLLVEHKNETQGISSYISLGEILIEKENYAMAMTLGSKVPSEHSKDYFDASFKAWSRLNPFSLMKHLPTLSIDIQYRAAIRLLESNHTIPIFEKKEVDYLWSLLPEPERGSESNEMFELLEILNKPNDWTVEAYLPNGRFKNVSGPEVHSYDLRRQRLAR